MSTMQDLVHFYGEPISTYTRQQALDDGILIDVTEWASPHEMRGGFNCPVAITRTLWAKVEAPKGSHQDTRGRAHDLLWMTSVAARTRAGAFLGGRPVSVSVKLGNRRYTCLAALDGDGITIGMPEDF